ncbi:phosphopyruvate hydratase [Candidatus Peregrinibacteria bacterium]|nr:phosphopyruvate hydratase [Candidatus Peregrinibacteria bacterium]
MPLILKLHARQILDSRGNPTIEVDCLLDDGSFGRAAVPSGVSTGVHEAVELRDGGKEFGGKGVTKAVANVEKEIAKALNGQDVSDQRAIDRMLIDLDGTPNKARLGGNAILGVSMAVCRARSASEKKSLWHSLADQYGAAIGKSVAMPVPLMVVIEGGAHSDAGLSFQEFMIVPDGFSSFSEALRAGVETFHALESLLHAAGHVTAVGAEGAFAPRVKTCGEALDFIVTAIGKAGYEGKIKLAVDAAASEFFADGSYTVDAKKLSRAELMAYYADLMERYPLISIEDSHGEDDWEGFIDMKKKFGSKVQLVGDDFLVTNTKRIKEAITKDAVNAVLIKVNQIGTVSETVDAIMMTHDAHWHPIVSHRGGDTEDAFISHLTIALQTGQIKTGAPSRSERTAKYNELLRIEEELGKKATYASPF